MSATKRRYGYVGRFIAEDCKSEYFTGRRERVREILLKIER